MDVIVGVIIALVIVSSLDRYLCPEEYVVERRPAHNRSRRTLWRTMRPVRPVLRRLTGDLHRRGSLSASHRCSISQVSPWLTSESYETVTARH